MKRSNFDKLTDAQKSRISILSLAKIKEELAPLSCTEVAKESGLSRPTVHSLRDTNRTNYTMSTILQISWYLNKLKRRK